MNHYRIAWALCCLLLWASCLVLFYRGKGTVALCLALTAYLMAKTWSLVIKD